MNGRDFTGVLRVSVATTCRRSIRRGKAEVSFKGRGLPKDYGTKLQVRAKPIMGALAARLTIESGRIGAGLGV